MRTVLPDCRAHDPLFALSPEDRRELVRRIAAEGPGAIDAFIKEREAQGDSLIAQRVRRLREQLLKRAEELRERLKGDFDAREHDLEAQYARRLAELQGEREQYARALDALPAGEAARLQALLRANPALGIALDAGAAAPRPPWWRRALRALARLVRFLLAPLLWVLRKLFPPPRKHDKRVVLSFPAADVVGNAGNLYLADASFRREVKSRLRAEPFGDRARRLWERMLGREDYETLAQRMMQQMLAEETERAHGEAEGEKKRLQDALRELAEREAATKKNLTEEERALRQAEERAMRELEETLRAAPEQQVKEAIVDELTSAGLLKRDLMPTLQFMDRFASLVYADEKAGAPGTRGLSAGELAEGEGLYIRGPMRSHVEVSHMDIPASLMRARSRHPRVRHMTDDDVVVHREDRASLTHVVLIVDRSGSMEERGRMDAAKRAALALHHAVRSRDRRNPVDVLLMDTSVTSASLREVWDATPRGFTNHGAALRMARQLIERRRAGRSLVYLVTDGLPEAYTRAEDGEDVAGHPDKAMKFAKAEARRLAKTNSFEGLVMLLLEIKEERHVKAAQALAAEAGNGRVVEVDPQELARTLLRQFESGDGAVARAP